MRFGNYIQSKVVFIGGCLIATSFSAVLLYAANANLYFSLFIPSIVLGGGAVVLAIDYLIMNSYYKEFEDTLERLDEKRFLLEVLPQPESLEGRIWYDGLRAATKSMNDAVALHREVLQDYREYIELWVHEVKTPLSGLKLALENSRNKALLGEIDKLERLVEQALFYARSGSVADDYSIRQTGLGELVKAALRSDARYLIQQKVRVEMGDLSARVLADSKWTVFILRQLIENAAKYGTQNLRFFGERVGGRVVLSVVDDGVGIPAEDVERVFDKGFTGSNGRKFGHSTGLGLYLCRKLCRKLGVGIELESELGAGTTVRLSFARKG